MVNVQKYTATQTRPLLDHDYRRTNQPNTVKKLECLNYSFKKTEDPEAFMQKKIEESKKTGGRVLSTSVVMCSVVITLPDDFKGDERKFFEECFRFYNKEFGEENCISAIVHKDEPTARPHLHYKFTPVIEQERINKKTGARKTVQQFNAKKIISRDYLQELHPKLENWMSAVFGYEVGIQTGGSTTQMKERIKDLEIELRETKTALKQEKRLHQETREKLNESREFEQASKMLQVNGKTLFQHIREYIQRMKKKGRERQREGQEMQQTNIKRDDFWER